MDFRYLKAFLSVARNKNFTQAGEDLNIAQSAVSRQIRLLEESVGHQLVIRSPQKVILTPAGQALQKQFESFEKWTQAFFHGSSQEIRIGVMSGVVDSWLVPRLASIDHEALPNFTLSIQNEKVIRNELEKGELDMGFLIEPIESESITSRILFHETYSLISKKDIDLNKLHLERWIYGSSGSFLKKVSKKVSPRFIRVNSVASIIELVREGLGVAVVPNQLIRVKRGIKIRPMKSIGEGKVYLAMPNYQIMPKSISQLLRHFSN